MKSILISNGYSVTDNQEVMRDDYVQQYYNATITILDPKPATQ